MRDLTLFGKKIVINTDPIAAVRAGLLLHHDVHVVNGVDSEQTFARAKLLNRKAHTQLYYQHFDK